MIGPSFTRDCKSPLRQAFQLLANDREDVLLNSLEGLEKSVALLKGVMPTAPWDFKLQAI